MATALAPIAWGSTYLVTTELLPPDRPLLDATLRALPAGLLLLALSRRRPHGSWWCKALVLGTLNIGAFFAMLFIAATLLPGGVAATVGAIQPLLVAVLASRMLGERLTARTLVAGSAGLAGVALLVLQAQARLDPLGVAAALGGAGSMALGAVLSKRWGRPESLVALTSWQLIAGGLVLAPLTLLIEGVPVQPLTATNIGGFVYLALIGTAVAYLLWFRGLQKLPASTTAFLGLLSPVVAVLLGWAVLGQQLVAGQLVGGVIVLGALAAAIGRRRTEHGEPAASRQ